MKRMHIHVGVENLDQSIRFYSALFGTEPVKKKADYAKWMIDDPRINFAISTRAGHKGVDHLGVQVDEEGELDELRERVRKAGLSLVDEGETVCCYARSEKSWLEDPSGVAWEAFKTMEDVQTFSRSESAGPLADGGAACCAPRPAGSGCC
ncbi:MAG: ArsI/CadI family heavy metal resistance metalloenzyme [Gammaproteobacteria bacterium]